MKIKCYMSSRRGTFDAQAIINEDNTITVMKGSVISKEISENLKVAKAVKANREDKTIVDENCTLLKDVTFKSLSTAAQFINGRSTNGYVAWKVDNNMTVKDYLMDKE